MEEKKYGILTKEELSKASGGADDFKIWYDGPKAHKGEMCPECNRCKLSFEQYYQDYAGTREIYFCRYCDDYVYFWM